MKRKDQVRVKEVAEEKGNQHGLTKFMYNGNSCDEYKSWLDHLEMLSYYSDIAAQEEKV